MDRKPLLGPLLGYHGDSLRSVTFVLTGRESDRPVVEWTCPGHAPHRSVASPIGEFVAGVSIVWKAMADLSSLPAGPVSYRVLVGGEALPGSWEGAGDTFTFLHEPDASKMSILFGSCMDRHDLAKWKAAPGRPANPAYGRFLSELPGRSGPVHLLILGGDQVYTDHYLGALLPVTAAGSSRQRTEVEAGIRQAYLEGWNRPVVATLLATIPNAMMWDDHDLVDGYGSYVRGDSWKNTMLRSWVRPEASRLFDLLQLRRAPSTTDRSWVLSQGDVVFAALDARTDREAVRNVVVDPAKLASFARSIEAKLGDDGSKTLVLVVPIPLLHLRFGSPIPLISIIPYPTLHEVIDDLVDNWSSSYNVQEERRMFQLVARWRSLARRVVILSGDSHMGSAGVLDCGQGRFAFQVTSSALENEPGNPGIITGIGGEVPRRGWSALRPWQKSSIWFGLPGTSLRYRMIPVERNHTGFDDTTNPFKDLDFFTTTRNAVVLRLGAQASVRWILEGNSPKAPKNPWPIP